MTKPMIDETDEPMARIMVRAKTAARLFDVSDDTIRALPIDEVPPRRVNRNLVLYAVADIIRYFDRYKVA